MKPHPYLNLSRRERQIMDALFRLGEATAAEVQAQLPDPPSYSAVRAHLRTLETKGLVRHEARDLRYVYMPVLKPAQVRRRALRHLVDTFFGGSAARLVATLLDEQSLRLDPEELDRLAEYIERSRRQERAGQQEGAK